MMPIFAKKEPTSAAAEPFPGTAAAPRRRHVNELYDPVQMGAVLRRERARSDRQHVSFSIVLFRLDDEPLEKRTLLRLATILLKCIRETDELGCYDARTLCAVLPDTGPAGAAMLVNRVRKETASKPYQPVCTVYTYPDPPATGGRTTISDRIEAQRAGVVAAGSPTLGMSAAIDSLSRLHVHPMSDLFAEPLPLWKRALDVAVASVAILLSSPLMIAAAPGSAATRSRSTSSAPCASAPRPSRPGFAPPASRMAPPSR
jgi:hypothetical protein